MVGMFLMGSYCVPLLVDSLLYYSIDNIFVWWACFSWVLTVPLLVDSLLYYSIDNIFVWWACFSLGSYCAPLLVDSLLYYSIDNIFVWWACFSWVLTVLLFSSTRSFIRMLTEANLMQYFFMKNEKKLPWSYNLTFRYINDVISLTKGAFQTW